LSVATTAASASATTAASASGSKCSAKVTFPKKTSPVSKYALYTTVFGIGIIGTGISDAKFQHVASMLAGWIDNDQDGCPDNPTVVTKIVEGKHVQWFGPGKDGGDATTVPDYTAIQAAGFNVGATLNDLEINPQCSGTLNGKDGCSDASGEEIWHLVTGEGYSAAFPADFSIEESSGSTVNKAMDVARGGHFTSIPSPYPTGAWYTYNDATCKYSCMSVEYIYWGMCSYLGMLELKTDVLDEWKFNTKAKLEAGDKLMTALIKDTSKYKLPTVAPNGVYTGCNTCSTGGVSHGGTA